MFLHLCVCVSCSYHRCILLSTLASRHNFYTSCKTWRIKLNSENIGGRLDVQIQNQGIFLSSQHISFHVNAQFKKQNVIDWKLQLWDDMFLLWVSYIHLFEQHWAFTRTVAKAKSKMQIQRFSNGSSRCREFEIYFHSFGLLYLHSQKTNVKTL